MFYFAQLVTDPSICGASFCKSLFGGLLSQWPCRRRRIRASLIATQASPPTTGSKIPMLETRALWALDPIYDIRISPAGTALEDHSMTRLLNALLRSETDALSSWSARTIETSKPYVLRLASADTFLETACEILSDFRFIEIARWASRSPILSAMFLFQSGFEGLLRSSLLISEIDRLSSADSPSWSLTSDRRSIRMASLLGVGAIICPCSLRSLLIASDAERTCAKVLLASVLSRCICGGPSINCTVTPGASLSPKNVFLRVSEKLDWLKLGDAFEVVLTEDGVGVAFEPKGAGSVYCHVDRKPL